MNTIANLPLRLEELLGRDSVLSSDDELQKFAIAGRTPLATVRPRNAGDVAETVRFAGAENLSVVCCGSRSKLEMGMPPQRYDLALDLSGLREVVHYDPADLTLSVDAGLTLNELAKVLAAKNQFLPLALPCSDRSTIGGAVASGIDSTLRQQYGTARDFLIGAEFVDGKGQPCKSGGRVVKNVTGYDLHKLLIGSLGTLAAITRLNFRTFPLPELRRGYLADFSSLGAALGFRAALIDSGLPLSNLELFDPEFAGRLAAHLKLASPSEADQLGKPAWNVYAAFEGNEALVRRIERELHQRATEAKAESSEMLEDSPNQRWSEALRESFDWLRRAAPSVALLRIVLPSIVHSDIGELLKQAPQGAARRIFLLRACGVAYLALLEENEDSSSKERLCGEVRGLFSWAERKRGSATLLYAPDWLKEKVNVWGPVRPDFALMQRVKRAFDPQNIFAPGRFVGGL